MNALDFDVVKGIFEALADLPPRARARAYWQMGIEEWEAIRRSRYFKDAAVESPGGYPLLPAARSLCGLPVSICSHGDVVLCIKTSGPA